MPRRRKHAPTSRIDMSATDSDGQELVAAAQRSVDKNTPQRRKAASKKKKSQSSKEAARSRSVAAAAEEAAKDRALSLDETGTDSDTRSSSDAWAGVSEPGSAKGSINFRSVILCLVACASLALSISAWRSAPQPNQRGVLLPPTEVPRPLFRQWVLAFPDSSALFARPDQDTLEAFAAFLGSQVSVKQVRGVRLEPDPNGAPGSSRLAIDLEMRKPLLPVVLETGEQSWISNDGRILPGILNGPKGQPKVRGIEYSDQESIDELVAIWPRLSREIDSFLPKLVSEIHLNAPLGSGTQRGLVFLTNPGTILTWGHPSEARFGVNREQRLEHLVHTLRCQGDLRRVPEINVRFSEPFAVVR